MSDLKMKIGSNEPVKIIQPALLPAKAERPRGRFPTPKDSQWEDVRMLFHDEHTLEISIRRIKRHFDYKDMGFRDARRKEPQPRESWKLLLMLGDHGRITWSMGKSSRQAVGEDFDGYGFSWKPGREEANFKKAKADLVRTMKAFFGITSDPFLQYNKSRGWEPKFQIRRFK